MVVSNNKANIVKIWTRAEFDNFQRFFSKLSGKQNYHIDFTTDEKAV